MASALAERLAGLLLFDAEGALCAAEAWVAAQDGGATELPAVRALLRGLCVSAAAEAAADKAHEAGGGSEGGERLPRSQRWAAALWALLDVVAGQLGDGLGPRLVGRAAEASLGWQPGQRGGGVLASARRLVGLGRTKAAVRQRLLLPAAAFAGSAAWADSQALVAEASGTPAGAGSSPQRRLVQLCLAAVSGTPLCMCRLSGEVRHATDGTCHECQGAVSSDAKAWRRPADPAALEACAGWFRLLAEGVEWALEVPDGADAVASFTALVGGCLPRMLEARALRPAASWAACLRRLTARRAPGAAALLGRALAWAADLLARDAGAPAQRCLAALLLAARPPEGTPLTPQVASSVQRCLRQQPEAAILRVWIAAAGVPSHSATPLPRHLSMGRQSFGGQRVAHGADWTRPAWQAHAVMSSQLGAGERSSSGAEGDADGGVGLLMTAAVRSCGCWGAQLDRGDDGCCCAAVLGLALPGGLGRTLQQLCAGKEGAAGSAVEAMPLARAAAALQALDAVLVWLAEKRPCTPSIEALLAERAGGSAAAVLQELPKRRSSSLYRLSGGGGTVEGGGLAEEGVAHLCDLMSSVLREVAAPGCGDAALLSALGTGVPISLALPEAVPLLGLPAGGEGAAPTWGLSCGRLCRALATQLSRLAGVEAPRTALLRAAAAALEAARVALRLPRQGAALPVSVDRASWVPWDEWTMGWKSHVDK
eukprot:jgi/Tetstr1/441882/TSEL_030092.t1